MLEKSYNGLIDFEFKHGGFIAIVIGWLATSERAQLVITASVWIRIAGTISIIALTILHAIWCSRWYTRARLAYTQIIALNYMSKNHYDAFKMGIYLPVSFIILHFIFSITVCIFIWTMKFIVPLINNC